MIPTLIVKIVTLKHLIASLIMLSHNNTLISNREIAHWPHKILQQHHC